jgi:alkaline phosphatase
MKKIINMKIILITVLLVFVSAGLCDALPRYIFLLIGDGMAEPDVIATESYVKDVQIMQGINPEDAKGLIMTSLPVTGKMMTFSKNQDITDSAASATALSSGYKVQNGALNIDTSTGRRFEPLGQFAKRHGYKVGLIASCAPNHATPAGFYAQAESRNMYPEIARQMAASDIDYIGGQYVMEVPKDEDNIKELAADNGFTIAGNRAEFDAIQPGAGKAWAYSPMPYVIDAEHEISLADHTAKAIELLKDSDRFFIMVEGSQIDWASHANDGAAMIYETIAFDEAISEAMKFYEQNPESTLIVATSDHECGGLSLEMEKVGARGMSKIIQAQKGSRNASASVFREIERGKMTFEEALPLMKDYFGISTLTEQELEDIRAAFTDGGEQTGDFSYGDNKKIALAWARLVSSRAGLIWSSLNHTADPVPVYAIGQQAKQFEGNNDNALIAWYIKGFIKEQSRK